MALMEDASKHYSVEFAGNRIYIYSSGFITTTEQLTQAFTLAKKLIDKIAPLASRLQNDSAIIATPVNLLNKRKHSLLSNKLGLAFLIIVTIAGIAIVVFAIITVPRQSSSNTMSRSQITSGSTVPSLNASAFPYCGTVPNAKMPSYTQQYVSSIIAHYKQLNTVSSEIKAANNTASNAVIEQLVAADQQYITSLKAINFPPSIQPDVASVITAVQNYVALITQEETSTLSGSALTSARNNQSNTASQLHTVLGLSPSTCGFYEP